MVLISAVAVSGFYLPGVAPRDYAEQELVEMKVNKLDSTVTQLPYDFYSLPFCQPDNIEASAENLGEVMSGDRIENSAYIVCCSSHLRFLLFPQHLTLTAGFMAMADMNDRS